MSEHSAICVTRNSRLTHLRCDCHTPQKDGACSCGRTLPCPLVSQPAPVAGEAGSTETAIRQRIAELERPNDNKFELREIAVRVAKEFATPHPVPGQTREVTAAPIKTNADEVCRASIKREWANLLALLEGHPNRSDILGCAHVLRNAERMQALGEVQNRAFFATVQGAAEAAAALEAEGLLTECMIRLAEDNDVGAGASHNLACATHAKCCAYFERRRAALSAPHAGQTK